MVGRGPGLWRRLIPGMAIGAETPRCMTYAMLQDSETQGIRIGLPKEGKLGHCIRDIIRIKSQI